MKKFFLTAAAVFAFGFANAQDKKESTGEGYSNGDVFISGTAGISTSKTGDFKTNTSVFSPSVGYFVADNIAVGLSIGFQTAKAEVPGFEATNSQTAVGVFGRYYTTPASKFSLFGQLGVNYLSYDNEFDGDFDAIEDKGDGFNISLSPGFNYFVSDNLALETSIGILGYTTTQSDAEGSESTDTFDLGLNLGNINFGVVYKF